ncbi:hypothetical protein [Lentzea flava]|uniref:hypothetical protein n=1 Tax=Lentzea flava TaxID=103732 RepID=UPI001671644D|nr:hypothetical protein [Lentzea flava]MCP2205551.1 hypothetical protein [Lentzea flava]
MSIWHTCSHARPINTLDWNAFLGRNLPLWKACSWYADEPRISRTRRPKPGSVSSAFISPRGTRATTRNCGVVLNASSRNVSASRLVLRTRWNIR